MMWIGDSTELVGWSFTVFVVFFGLNLSSTATIMVFYSHSKPQEKKKKSDDTDFSSDSELTGEQDQAAIHSSMRTEDEMHFSEDEVEDSGADDDSSSSV